MSMYNEFDFQITPLHPSGIPSYKSGKASVQRHFAVPCEFAEEFALRMIGKFYRIASTDPDTDEPIPGYSRPILPAPYAYRGQMNMVAVGFTITPVSACCLNTQYSTVEGPDTIYLTQVTNPVDAQQTEKYYYAARDSAEEPQNGECICDVVIDFEENPCDCLQWDQTDSTWVAHEEILPDTCVSTLRNPAYEMFTLPNANLVWKNLRNGDGTQAQLKADSYAYKIVPKADIIVSWHNVPVKSLCQIETHLRRFRGHVNDRQWGESLQCNLVSEPDPYDPPIECRFYEKETILFIDWEEDRSQRTDTFDGIGEDGAAYNMNTTTLKLHFKQKRVEFPADNFDPYDDNDSPDIDGDGQPDVDAEGNPLPSIAGWNHLFNDTDTAGYPLWMRVVVKSTQQPIFPLMSFTDIFYPQPL